MSDKYIKEIDDILKKASDVARKEPAYRNPSRRSLRLINPFNNRKLGHKFQNMSPGKLMLTGLAVFLLGLILNLITKGAVTFLVWSGIILFAIGYVWYIFRPSTGTTVKYEKKWRGRPIDDDKPVSLVDKFKRLFKVK